MNEEVRLKLKEEKDYLEVVEFAMKQLLTTYSSKRNAKKLNKQQKTFDKFKLNSNYKKYNKQTLANMKDLNVICTRDDEIESALEQEFNKFDKDKFINKVMESFQHESYLDDKISKLFSEYVKTKNNIDMYTRTIERGNLLKNNVKQETHIYKEPEIELSFEERFEERKKKEIAENEKKVDAISKSLLAGPKKPSISEMFNKKDMIKGDIAYLYGLAADILVLMQEDQSVRVKKRREGEEYHIYNISFPYCEEYKKNQILSKYHVSTVDQLLDVYEKIRQPFYKKYLKLKDNDKKKYEYSNYESREIICSFGTYSDIDFQIDKSFETEKYNFPPSKQELINSINLRIFNSEYFDYVIPKKDENVLGEPKDYQRYFQVKKSYENLTKNMDVQQVVSLYKKVQEYLRNEASYSYNKELAEDLTNYNGIIQKIFSEIIFAKKNKKFSDSKQQDTALLKIVKEDLKEQVMFSMNATDELNQKETNVRQETIEKEYIKYRAKLNLEGKKEYLSFKEFASQKYSLQNIEASENLELMIQNETNSVKK